MHDGPVHGRARHEEPLGIERRAEERAVVCWNLEQAAARLRVRHQRAPRVVGAQRRRVAQDEEPEPRACDGDVQALFVDQEAQTACTATVSEAAEQQRSGEHNPTAAVVCPNTGKDDEVFLAALKPIDRVDFDISKLAGPATRTRTDQLGARFVSLTCS